MTTTDEATREQGAVTPAMEDFLKAVFRVRDDDGVATIQRLADALEVSGPSATNMAKRLHELGLVRHTRYRGVELTEAGEHIALEVMRHHRLLELYLANELGYSWEEVHAEAERLEHHVSERFEARIDSLLGHPTHDPHGDPIPSREGTIAPESDYPLLDLPSGVSAAISRVSDQDPERLRYLGDLGIRPGAVVSILEHMPFDGPLRIGVEGEEHIIGRPLAAALHVSARGRGTESNARRHWPSSSGPR